VSLRAREGAARARCRFAVSPSQAGAGGDRPAATWWLHGAGPAVYPGCGRVARPRRSSAPPWA
jgi:hypothetical protein